MPHGVPEQPLTYTRPEIEEVTRRWRQAGGHATVKRNALHADVTAALPAHAVWHFACHCQAIPDQVLDSNLMLDGEPLTLRTLLGLRLPPETCRLAVLSACRSHRSGRRLPDEAMGMPGGLMQAGLAGIIATHWVVADDRSTVLLLAKFHDLWRIEGLDPASALSGAQQWIRHATQADLHAYLPHRFPRSQAQAAHVQRLWATAEPFEHPYYWAAFALTGA